MPSKSAPKSILLKGGVVINAYWVQIADVRISGGKIVRIERNLKALKDEQVIDCRGMLIFPGGIDPHTHYHLPFMGTVSCDNPLRASRGAIIDGTTTNIEMLLVDPGQDPREALRIWLEMYRQACGDYTFHCAVTSWDEANSESWLTEIVQKHGITSFKVFLAYLGALDISDRDLYRTLSLAKKLGVITTAHCENAVVIAQNQQRLLAAGHTGPEFHYHSRPPGVEAAGVAHFCSMLQATDATGYIVHLTCEEALRQALEYQRMGVRVSVEVLIQHLLMTKAAAEQPDFIGANFVMSPPLRSEKDPPILTNALVSGQAKTIGSDHAAFTPAQKRMGLGDFSKIPNGMASAGNRFRLAYTHLVASGKMTPSQFVAVISTNAAQLFALDTKGRIEVGYDADIVVYDPNFDDTIPEPADGLPNGLTSFVGWKVKGRCDHVFSRGVLQAHQGEFVGDTGHGQFLSRKVPAV